MKRQTLVIETENGRILNIYGLDDSIDVVMIDADVDGYAPEDIITIGAQPYFWREERVDCCESDRKMVRAVIQATRSN